MDRLSVRGDDSQSMSFNSDLCWTNCSKRVDDSESVSAPWRHSEDFKWRVGHEAGVGVSELPFAVDERTLRILTGVNSQATRIPFRCVLVHPVAEQHNVRRQIEVVQV